MFHTVEIFIKISNREYFCWLNTFYSIADKRKAQFYPIEESEHEHEYIFRGFENSGINIFLRSYECESYKYYEMSIILNPKRLLKNNEYIDVAREEELPVIATRFKRIMLLLKEEFNKKCLDEFIYIYHNLLNYNVRRIDYCVNVKVNNVDKVINLIKRGDIPKKFYEYTEYDKKSKRKVSGKDSFYLMSKSGNITINIYAKYNQMKKDKYYKDIDITKAKGILRIEVQCKSKKIRSIEQAFALESRDIFSLATYDIARREILCYLYKTIGFEDYTTFKKAKVKINGCENLKAKTKTKMIEILRLINQKRSIYRAREIYDDDNKFYKLLNKIKKLDINPVTVPEEWKMEVSNPVCGIVKELMSTHEKVNIN